MAWTFDGTAHVTIPDDAALTIPNGDWTIAGWYRVSDNTGTDYRRLFAWGTAGGTPHVQIFLPGISTGVSNSDYVSARVIGTGGADTAVIFPTGVKISDMYDEWVPIALTHDNSTNTTYLRVLDKANSVYYSDSSVIGLGEINIGEAAYLGANSGLGSNRFIGDMAEWAFFPGLFMDDNSFHGFIHGGRSHRFSDCSWHVPMLRDRSEEWIGQLTLSQTNVDDTTEDHPPLQLITPVAYDDVEIPSTGSLRVTNQSVIASGTSDGDLVIGTQSLDVALLYEPRIQLHQLAVEYLQTVTQPPAIIEVSASNALTLDQDVAVSAPNQRVTQTLTITQAADYVWEQRTQAVEQTITLNQQASFVGPKHLEGINVLNLVDSAHVGQTHNLFAFDTIELTQDTEFHGTIRVEASNVLAISDLADNIVKVRSAENTITLTDTATVDKIITVHQHIELTQSVQLGATSVSAENTLVLTQDARFNPKTIGPGDEYHYVLDPVVIELTDEARVNMRMLSVEQTIELDQDVGIIKPTRVSAESELTTTEEEYNPDTGLLETNLTGLRDEASVVVIGTHSASNHLSFSETISAGHVRANGTSVSASNTLTLTDSARLSLVGEASDTITLTQSATAVAGRYAKNQLELTDAASFTIQQGVSVSQTIDIRDSSAFTLVIGSTRCQYSPFVGSSSDPDAPDPPPLTINEPLVGIQVPFQLVYPADGSPVTDSISLKAPNLGNRDRLTFNRISRETRGGTVVVFADPDWPQIETQVVQFSGLFRVEANNLLTFIEDHLGLEIGMIDWEHRYWKGIISVPDEPVVEDKFDSFTASFQFQGELDPDWTPQVVPPSQRYSSIRTPREDGYYVPTEPQIPPTPDTIHFLTAETDSDLVIGQPVYVKGTGHIDLAVATSSGTAQVAGLAITNTSAGVAASYMPEDQVTRTDWTPITGTVSLQTGANYFLDTTTGKLTTSPPSASGQYVVRVGRATSVTTMDIEIDHPILL